MYCSDVATTDRRAEASHGADEEDIARSRESRFNRRGRQDRGSRSTGQHQILLAHHRHRCQVSTSGRHVLPIHPGMTYTKDFYFWKNSPII